MEVSAFGTKTAVHTPTVIGSNRCKAADQTSGSKDRRGSKPIKFAPSLPHQTATPLPPYPSHPHNPSARTRHSTGAMNTHSSANAATQHSPASAIQATE